MLIWLALWLAVPLGSNERCSPGSSGRCSAWRRDHTTDTLAWRLPAATCRFSAGARSSRWARATSGSRMRAHSTQPWCSGSPTASSLATLRPRVGRRSARSRSAQMTLWTWSWRARRRSRMRSPSKAALDSGPSPLLRLSRRRSRHALEPLRQRLDSRPRPLNRARSFSGRRFRAPMRLAGPLALFRRVNAITREWKKYRQAEMRSLQVPRSA